MLTVQELILYINFGISFVYLQYWGLSMALEAFFLLSHIPRPPLLFIYFHVQTASREVANLAMNSASASCNCQPASPDLAVLGFLVENKARLSGFGTSHACMHASGDHYLAVILFHMVYNYLGGCFFGHRLYLRDWFGIDLFCFSFTSGGGIGGQWHNVFCDTTRSCCVQFFFTEIPLVLCFLIFFLSS